MNYSVHWLRIRLAVLVGLVVMMNAPDETRGQTGASSPTNKVQTENGSQLLEENPHFKVSRVAVASGSSANIDRHGHDGILVSLGIGLSLTQGKGPEARNLKDGEVWFLPLTLPAKVANSADGPTQILVVELKRHWDVEVRTCSEPSKCTRPVMIGEFAIGETTSIFTNGFISAYQHRLDAGGTLSSSYFSARGKDHLLLIALADLRADFDGTEERLKAGQVYASDATQVEVNAGSRPIRWVVIRMQVPKSETPPS